MAISTNLISGLSSGFDWRSMIDQLIAIDHRRVDLLEAKKTEYETKLSEWQTVNTKLLALKTKAQALSNESSFKNFSATLNSNTSTAAADILSVTTGSAASPGTYGIKVINLAQSEKISSRSFTALNSALSLSGDILISGKVVNIVGTDTLTGIKDKINALNTGSTPSNVTASIVQHSPTDYHLVLTSDKTGSAGIDILEGSSSGLLQTMGFITSSVQIRTATSDGAMSALFSDSTSVAGTLLGLAGAPGAVTVQIGGRNVDIDLSSQSITAIAANIDALDGISAEVISEEVNGITKYRIDISGSTSFSDNGNVLQILGILEGVHGSVTQALKGSSANTAGGLAVTSGTVWNTIDGADVQDNTSFTISGKKHDGTAVSGTYTILDASAGTIDDLLSAIEAVFGDTVTAAIDDSGRITVTDTVSGDSRLELTLTTNNQPGGTLNFGTVATYEEGRSMQITAGEDAELVVDNVTVRKSSNTIDDIIQGVTLALKGESASTTVTLQVKRDIEATRLKIQEFVNTYNDIMKYINTQFSYDEESGKAGGVLFGDGTLYSVKSGLVAAMTETVTGLSAGYNRLSLIGVSLDKNVNLTIDNEVLGNALQSNFDDVKKLFIAYGSASNSQLQYISHTKNTTGGIYDISVTQPATRTTVTGAVSLGGTLGGDETVTIRDFSTGRLATAALTGSMDIDDIVNAINTELSRTYTEQLRGGADTGFTAATLFSAIDGAEDGDVITFSGTSRNGLLVNGSYTVNTADNIGTLLSAIEGMFDNQVTASLDSGGKLIITDKESGDSRIALTVNSSSVTGLDFGTVSTYTEGRYAMPITASKTEGNNLLLTHNEYGTGHIIVVDESGGTALGLAAAEISYGVNVAGAINGIAATGKGRTLTLESSGNSADGLSVLYTGASPMSATLNLTLGVADLLQRQLGFITDATDGYLKFKQTSLKSSIDGYGKQIDSLEAALERKTENLINQFVAMEMALSEIQNQSAWLAGQISAAESVWD